MSQIDQSALENIRALQRPGAPDILGRIITIFLTQTPDLVQGIVEAVESGELEIVRNNAHSLKSSAAYVGAVEYSTKMADIERAAREEQLDSCKQLTTGLNEHTAEVIGELTVLQDQAA